MTMLGLKLWFLVICALFASLWVSPSFGETLPEAVRIMLKHEPELLAVDADSRSSYYDWRLKRADQLPHISLSSSSGYSRRDRSTDALINQSSGDLYSRDVGVSLRQLLFDGGGAKNRTLSAEEAYRAQRFLQMGMIEQRVVDLAEVYLELIRIREQMAAARENLDDHRSFRAKLQRREELGGIRSDTSLIDGRLNLAENTLATLQLKMDTALSRYRRLTGKKPGKLTFPKIPHVSGGENVDLTNNWDYLAACATLKSKQANWKSTIAENKPSIYIDAGASEGRDTIGVSGRDRDFHALLGVSWDLYKGGGRKALQNREEWQVVRARELLRAADELSRQQARDILSERKGSSSSRHSLSRYVSRLTTVADDYEKQFEIGNRELLNLLDLRNERYQARSQLIDARFNEMMSNYRLMGIQGRLVTHLIGDDVTKHVGLERLRADDWYCEVKSNLDLVSCDCEIEQNSGCPKCLTPIRCSEPICAVPVDEPVPSKSAEERSKKPKGGFLKRLFRGKK